MERPKYDHQYVHEYDDDDVGKGDRYCTMTMSADETERWLPSWGDVALGERYSSPSTQQTPLPTTRSRRKPRPLRWQQRSPFGTVGCLLVLIASLLVIPISAVLIEFQNCLSDSYQNDTPLLLQFDPLFLDAVYTNGSNHNLNITVWGNVTGTGPQTLTALPPSNDTGYWDSNQTQHGGKIQNIPDPPPGVDKYTTLFNKVNVLTYEPYSSTVNFCEQLINASCPLGPSFDANASIPSDFPAFSLANNFYSTYAFTSFTPTLLIKNGDSDATVIGCVSASVTPDLGSTLKAVFTFIPVVVLICVGAATAFAAIFSPWGTTDVFRWTTNYGRDADLLRLVTPGFGDCLQYIQFIALTSGLTLNYPGFYRPVASHVAWSALMFNQSFVSQGNGYQALVDGIYVTSGTYGLNRLRQLVGMSDSDDIWAGMAVWLLVIIAAILTLIQIMFLFRWGYRHIQNTQEEDLRAKNMPFSMGNVIRIVFGYFLLPIVALSMFQLVTASNSPTYTVALAAVMLVLIIGFAIWLLYFIATTRPRSFLFDDLPTVLLYGSLYNTYSDNAAPFALVPVSLTFVRGIAIGAIQASGIAQLVILAICEVITFLTLHAFRPFHSPTSMNAYHTFFVIVRFAVILLMISFAPSLGVTEGPKGWIGYAILLMHAIVLIFGFLLNAVQTIVEVGARMAGAGGDENGVTRGGLVRVFGMRQLSRRLPRRDGGSRQSQLSSAAMLDGGDERKSYMMESGRMRSQSAGSNGVLLNRQSTGPDSIGIEAFGAIPPQQLGSGASSNTPTTPGEASTFSFLPSAAAPSGLGRDRGPILGLQTAETADPYYRPPRMRRPTLEAYSPGARSRGSWASGEWANRRWSQPDPDAPEPAEEDPSTPGRASPVIQIPPPPDGSPNDPRGSKADYSTREVDFYYGVRGPALNANIPNRKIKTGPADPTGIPASAAGWVKNLFGGKTKEKGKGFEVVRSSRMPPGMTNALAQGEESPPEGIPVATDVVRNGPIDSDDEEGPASAGPSNVAEAAPEHENLVSPLGSDDEVSDEDFELSRISDVPPMLPSIEIGEGDIELPSRFPSKATSRADSRRSAAQTDSSLMPGIPRRIPSGKPHVPRKSSRRKSQSLDATPASSIFHQQNASVDSARMPFDSTSSNRQSTISTRSSIAAPEISSHAGNPSRPANYLDERPTSVGYVNQHSIRTINQSEHPEFLGASAEVQVVDGRNSDGSSVEHQNRV